VTIILDYQIADEFAQKVEVIKEAQCMICESKEGLVPFKESCVCEACIAFIKEIE